MNALWTYGAGLLVSGVFISLAVSQNKTWIPSTIFLLVGGSLMTILPPEFVAVAWLMVILSLAGMFYWFFTPRRT